MGLAYDNTTTYQSPNETVSTFSHTTSGSNRILFVSVTINGGGAANISGVTYGGVSMTAVTGSPIEFVGNNIELSAWYLINPSSGANNVVVTSTSGRDKAIVATSYSGAKQSGQPEVTNAANTSPITPSTAGAWVAAFSYSDGGVTASGTWTNRGAASIGGGGGNTSTFSDSGVINPASSTAIGLAGTDLKYFLISIAPDTVVYTLTATQGSYVYTGFASALGRAIILIAEAGAYVYTGFASTFLFRGWLNQSKGSSSWTNSQKGNSNWTNTSKDNSTWTNQTK